MNMASAQQVESVRPVGSYVLLIFYRTIDSQIYFGRRDSPAGCRIELSLKSRQACSCLPYLRDNGTLQNVLLVGCDEEAGLHFNLD